MFVTSTSALSLSPFSSLSFSLLVVPVSNISKDGVETLKAEVIAAARGRRLVGISVPKVFLALNRHIGKERDREPERERESETETETDRNRDRQRETHIESRGTERQRERARDGETQRQRRENIQ